MHNIFVINLSFILYLKRQRNFQHLQWSASDVWFCLNLISLLFRSHLKSKTIVSYCWSFAALMQRIWIVFCPAGSWAYWWAGLAALQRCCHSSDLSVCFLHQSQVLSGLSHQQPDTHWASRSSRTTRGTRQSCKSLFSLFIIYYLFVIIIASVR